MLRYSKDGLHLTESFEGCKLRAYQDSKGIWTIGYGHTRGVYSGLVCTQSQAEAWLLQDADRAERRVRELVRVPLDQLEYDALVDFEFNTGHLRGSTLLEKLNAGDYKGAALEFERWDMCGGKHLAGLLKRRKAERVEFEQDLPRETVA